MRLLLSGLLAAMILAPAGLAQQQCWGPVSRGPVRIAPTRPGTKPLPPAIKPPNTEPADGYVKDGWTWSTQWKCWWRYKPLGLKSRPKPASVKTGCACCQGCECPSKEECECLKTGLLCHKDCTCVLPAEKNFGVDHAKIPQARLYTLNGQPVTRDLAIRAVEAGVPDDVAKDRLTWVGDAATGEKARQSLGSWADKVLFQAYTPDSWVVTSRGLKPGLTLQSPDGKVLAQSPTFDGPDWLDKWMKREPKAPVLPPVWPHPAPLGLPWPALILLGLAGLLLLPKKDTPNG